MLNVAVNSKGIKMGVLQKLIYFQSETPKWAFEELQQNLGDDTVASYTIW